MEKIYEDFTTKLLPKIATGLTITKDYFMDLFARDIKYLIITDTVWTLVGLFMIIAGVIVLVKALKIPNQKSIYVEDMEEWNDIKSFLIILLAPTLFSIGLSLFFFKLDNLIKDKYLPEIRVYEQFQSYKNN